MKILQAHPYIAPAKDQMGIERFVESMTQGLVNAGHDVYMKLHPDTKVSPIEGAKLVDKLPEFGEIDIVHYHGWEPHDYMKTKVAWITSIHGTSLHQFPELGKNNPNMMGTSKFAADRIGALNFIHNCSDENIFTFNDQKEDYFLWMAGTDWQAGQDGKGLWRTITLAKKLKFKLKIAGIGQNKQVIEQIKQLCDDRIEYIGAVNGKEKVDVLKKAKALILLTQLPDTCPISVSEALLCGTPVVGSTNGSMPELIVNSQTGYLCVSEQDAAKAILTINKIKPIDCRKYAED